MLTQNIDDIDGYYDQYTIYPLYEKKSHESATNLYQMLMICPREKDLNLLCFSDSIHLVLIRTMSN